MASGRLLFDIVHRAERAESFDVLLGFLAMPLKPFFSTLVVVTHWMEDRKEAVSLTMNRDSRTSFGRTYTGSPAASGSIS
jgi:hypothetical protein